MTEQTIAESVNTARKYVYADSVAKQVKIETSFPKGIKYSEPNGKEYSRNKFWIIISNETDNAVELIFDFPEDSFEIPSIPDKFFKPGGLKYCSIQI